MVGKYVLIIYVNHHYEESSQERAKQWNTFKKICKFVGEYFLFEKIFHFNRYI